MDRDKRDADHNQGTPPARRDNDRQQKKGPPSARKIVAQVVGALGKRHGERHRRDADGDDNDNERNKKPVSVPD